jgi:hypothetical protein
MSTQHSPASHPRSYFETLFHTIRDCASSASAQLPSEVPESEEYVQPQSVFDWYHCSHPVRHRARLSTPTTKDNAANDSASVLASAKPAALKTSEQERQGLAQEQARVESMHSLVMHSLGMP